ncbi:MAG: hypothetical protein Q9169_003788 [Polycauliona sp. 2 TL-2023]
MSASTSWRDRTTSDHESSSSVAEHIGRSSPPTPSTPMRKKSVIKDTTPHQQELWSMLLPCQTEPGPGGCTLGSPIATTNKPPQPSNTKANVMTKATRRPRLVDKLRSTERRSPISPPLSPSLTVLTGPQEKSVPELNKAHPSMANERGLLANLVPKATYSSQRSYLAAGVLDDTSVFGVPLMDGDEKPRKRLRTETISSDFGNPESLPENDFDDSQGSSMRTIHELRESGENARHLDDTEALFDDINGQSLASVSLKRRRLLELVHRLNDPAFCRLLFDQEFDKRLLLESASRGNDDVADALLAVAVLHLAAAPSGIQAASKADNLQLAQFLATKLDREQDLLGLIRNRRSNLSKQEQGDLKDYFVEGLLRSPIWRSGAPVRPSVRLIVLQGLDYFIRTRRELGCEDGILPAEIVDRLVQGLLSAQRRVNPNVDLLLEVRLAISILESYTISSAKDKDPQWTETMLGPITTMLSWLSCLPDTGGEETHKLTLRLYLNLTNNNPQLCETFAKDEVLRAIISVVESHFQMLSDGKQGLSGSDVLDTLILALGTLINLVEWSSTVRHTVTCVNDEDDCFLGTLVQLFVAQQKAVAEVYSEEETSSNVAFGYLSVLLSYLCVEDDARQLVASHLPGGTLQTLLDTVVEFLRYHRQIDDGIDQEDGEMNLKASFMGRVESTVLDLRQMR